MLHSCEAQASLHSVFKMSAEDDVRILTEETNTAICSISNFRSHS